MVDGGPTNPNSGVSAPTGYKGEFYVEDYNALMKLTEAPLQALSRKSKGILSQLLNGIKILPSEEGYLRDWRGLAHCAKVKSEFVTFLADRADPTKELLEHWAKQSNSCKLSDLQTFLGQIDRWDVIDDTNESFLSDAEQYVDLIQKKQLQVASHVPSHDDHSSSSYNSDQKTADDEHEERILTEDDVKLAQRGLPPQQYHAFVLYADEDVEFATQVIERMETAGLKLCDKSRDLLGGSISHDAILRLIRERCNRLIVIVSPAFLESRANTFFMTYAQALGIEQRRRKIVPCIYKQCILPAQLNFYFSLHYEKRGKLFNFWDKLQQSIQSPDNYSSLASANASASSVGVLSPKIKITDIDSVNHVEVVREAGPQMFPPPPKLRAGSSMFDLSVSGESDQSPVSVKTYKKSPSLLSRFRKGDKQKSKSSWDLSSKSPTTVSLGSSGGGENSSTTGESLLSPDTLETSSLSNKSVSSKNKNMEWLKKMLTPKSSREKKKNQLPKGDASPTSMRSLNSQFYLGPAPPTDECSSSGTETHKKEKKKKKLLAW